MLSEALLLKACLVLSCFPPDHFQYHFIIKSQVHTEKKNACARVHTHPPTLSLTLLKTHHPNLRPFLLYIVVAELSPPKSLPNHTISVIFIYLLPNGLCAALKSRIHLMLTVCNENDASDAGKLILEVRL